MMKLRIRKIRYTCYTLAFSKTLLFIFVTEKRHFIEVKCLPIFYILGERKEVYYEFLES